MRFKTDWLRWAVGGLGFVAAGMMIAMWLATEVDAPPLAVSEPPTPATRAALAPPPPPPLEAAAAVPSPTLLLPAGKPAQPASVRAQAPPAPSPTPALPLPQRPAGDVANLSATAKEELGRWTLNHVGADNEATEIWLELINDRELSAKVRQDLIEDLNENGFSGGNGRTATVDDLPLIASRIQLIEEHAATALDETNAAAFAEAYKDLVNLWQRLSQQ
jgi:hypothetical protein